MRVGFDLNGKFDRAGDAAEPFTLRGDDFQIGIAGVIWREVTLQELGVSGGGEVKPLLYVNIQAESGAHQEQGDGTEDNEEFFEEHGEVLSMGEAITQSGAAGMV